MATHSSENIVYHGWAGDGGSPWSATVSNGLVTHVSFQGKPTVTSDRIHYRGWNKHDAVAILQQGKFKVFNAGASAPGNFADPIRYFTADWTLWEAVWDGKVFEHTRGPLHFAPRSAVLPGNVHIDPGSETTDHCEGNTLTWKDGAGDEHHVALQRHESVNVVFPIAKAGSWEYRSYEGDGRTGFSDSVSWVQASITWEPSGHKFGNLKLVSVGHA